LGFRRLINGTPYRRAVQQGFRRNGVSEGEVEHVMTNDVVLIDARSGDWLHNYLNPEAARIAQPPCWRRSVRGAAPR
jgi:hypothetical protein